MIGFTDLHQHFLWEMDDGPENYQLSCEMLKRSALEGITRIAATPHAYPGYHEFKLSQYREKLDRLRTFCQNEKLSIELLEGAEIRYTDKALDMVRDGRIPTLGGSRYVLLEFPNDIRWDDFAAAVSSFFRSGHIPIVAHAERYYCLMLSASRAIRLQRDIDLCYQINCGSIMQPRMLLQKRFIRKMLDAGAVDVIASDAHDCDMRPPQMQDAWKFICERCGREYADAVASFDFA